MFICICTGINLWGSFTQNRHFSIRKSSFLYIRVAWTCLCLAAATGFAAQRRRRLRRRVRCDKKGEKSARVWLNERHKALERRRLAAETDMPTPSSVTAYTRTLLYNTISQHSCASYYAHAMSKATDETALGSWVNIPSKAGVQCPWAASFGIMNTCFSNEHGTSIVKREWWRSGLIIWKLSFEGNSRDPNGKWYAWTPTNGLAVYIYDNSKTISLVYHHQHHHCHWPMACVCGNSVVPFTMHQCTNAPAMAPSKTVVLPYRCTGNKRGMIK